MNGRRVRLRWNVSPAEPAPQLLTHETAAPDAADEPAQFKVRKMWQQTRRIEATRGRQSVDIVGTCRVHSAQHGILGTR